MPRISVAVRLRPELDSNGPDRRLEGLSTNLDEKAIYISVSGTQHHFTFDHLFLEESKQDEVFQSTTLTIIDTALDGYNGTIFAYGQTGAGKTHTMCGSLNGSQNQYGICAMTAIKLFENARKTHDTITFKLSILEIYNETLYDLLVEQNNTAFTATFGAPNAPNPNLPKLNCIETETGVIVPALKIMPISSAHDALNLLIDAQANRAVAEHQLNTRSSRSHMIYTYYITRTKVTAKAKVTTLKQQQPADETDPIIHQSKLHLVDLAGCERMSKTGSTGTVQKEANYINKSLSYLEQVVIALTQNNRGHIPYRQSKLTYLLKDSLGGNCNTFMIACVWPRKDHVWETLSTLRFATRMQAIELLPIRNRLFPKDLAPSSALQRQIESLKRELAARDQMQGKEAWLPDLNTQQIHSTYKDCIPAICVQSLSSKNVESEPFEMKIHSLSQAHLVMNILQRALWHSCQQDSVQVSAALKGAMIEHSSLSDDKVDGLFRIGEIPITEVDGGNQRNNEARFDNERNNMEMDDNVESNRDEGQNSNTHAGKSGEELFAEFTHTEQGAILNQAYEDAKKTLKGNKSRQKEIVELMNSHKTVIDQLTNQLQEITSNQDENTNDQTVVDDMNKKLNESKKHYRVAHKELQICKEQITETQSLKSQALTAMMDAFAQYVG